MYELFEQAIIAYNSGNEHAFIASVINWLSEAENNPFAENTAERQMFFKAKIYFTKWMAGGIDMRSSRRNMIDYAKKIFERQPANPYKKETKKQEQKKEAKKEIKKEEKKEIKKEEKKEESEISEKDLKEDVNYLLACMVNAKNNNNNASYEMYVTHLMDMNIENPFKQGTDEYEMFSTMKLCYTHIPPNKRRTFVVGKQLCDLINNTPVEEKPKETVLGVIPEEKKNWLKFLFPWKKEGESNDSSGAN